MTPTPAQNFTITLAETGEQLTVAANDWREALISVNRTDAITVVHYPHIKLGKLQYGYAACRLIALVPNPFPHLVVAESAGAAFDEALAAFKESR